MSNENLRALVELFHHRWNVPTLATLGASGSRFITLQKSLGASRDALRASLDALTDAELVDRNPGYGHPLRPEYVLTDRGVSLAPAAEAYRRSADALGVADIAYRKWTGPVLLVMGNGVGGFNAMEDALGTITPRALTQALKALAAAHLVARTVDDGYPPRTSYVLSSAGSRLAEAAAAIATLLSER